VWQIYRSQKIARRELKIYKKMAKIKLIGPTAAWG
jgi:hypothetical protein